MILNWMESTSTKTVENYSGPWLKFRKDRFITPDQTFVFTDGSSTGWHAATIIGPGKAIREISKFEITPNRNINPELNGVVIGLEGVDSGSKLTVVSDLLGAGAWVIGAWKINRPEVREKVDLIRRIIKDKNLSVHFVHHEGHQNRKKGERPICNSDFTKWNVNCDKLCGVKQAHDSLTVVGK